MKMDGYAVLAINQDGTKAHLVERKSHDARLEECVSWVDMNIEETLIPNNISDCLVMVFFKYESVRSTGWEYVEYEEILGVVDFVVLQESYKEFWREQISFEITYDGHAEYPRVCEPDEEDWIDELIEEWEMLYDEDFELHKKYDTKNK